MSKPSSPPKPNLSRIEWDVAVAQYEADLRIARRSPATIKSYLDTLRKFKIWCAGNASLKMRDIQPDHARGFINSRLQQDTLYANHPFHKPQRRGLSPFTVHRDVRTLKAFGIWLMNNGYTNPFTVLKRPKLPERLINVLVPSEITALLMAHNPNTHIGARWQALLSFALETGVRLSELVNLSLDRLELEQRRARVIGKGDKERYVRFGDRTFKALNRYLVLYRQPKEPTQQVFLSLDGEPLTLDGAQKLLQRVARETGITRVHWHLIRHTFATYYLATEQGTVDMLRELMGHREITATMIYVHASQKLRDVLGMNGLVPPAKPSMLDQLKVELGRESKRLNSHPNG